MPHVSASEIIDIRALVMKMKHWFSPSLSPPYALRGVYVQKKHETAVHNLTTMSSVSLRYHDN